MYVLGDLSNSRAVMSPGSYSWAGRGHALGQGLPTRSAKINTLGCRQGDQVGLPLVIKLPGRWSGRIPNRSAWTRSWQHATASQATVVLQTVVLLGRPSVPPFGAGLGQGSDRAELLPGEFAFLHRIHVLILVHRYRIRSLSRGRSTATVSSVSTANSSWKTQAGILPEGRRRAVLLHSPVGRCGTTASTLTVAWAISDALMWCCDGNSPVAWRP